METFIALLRGINVSGQKMIRMEELKQSLASLNFRNIRTYIQSGNIVFETEKTGSHNLEKQIGEKILDHFGFHVPVVIRTRKELEIVHSNNPFLGERNEPVEKLHVTFIAAETGADVLNKLERDLFLPDEYFILGREVYLFCPNGYGRTKLTNQYFESKLKTTATTRNWKTIETLVRM